MTRVVMVAGTYRPERCGVAHYVQRLRSALDERGVSSLVLTTKEAARESKDQRVKGVVDGWGLPDLPALVRAVRQARPDVIHVQHAAGAYGFKRAVFFLPPLLHAAGCSAPLVTTVHEYGWWEWEPRGIPPGAIEALKTWGQRRGMWDREDGFLLTGSDVLLTTNTHAESSITERLPCLSSRMRRVPLVANVDTAPVGRAEARDEARSRYGWPPDAEIVTYFGFLHPVKGIENLLKAHKKVLESRPKARLLLIGSIESLALGDEADWYWNELQTLAKELGLGETVEMTGYVSDEEVSRLLSGADVGVLPFNEGVTLKSGTLLALFAHGLPVVATRPDPAEPELADGRLLRLVERRDVSGISAVLSELLADAPQRAHLGEAGRIYTRNLSWSAIAERHEEVYESVLKSGKSIRRSLTGISLRHRRNCDRTGLPGPASGYVSSNREGRLMGATLGQRIVDRLGWLDTLAEKVQPKVQEAIDEGEEKVGTTVRNALDGTWLGTPLHPALSDVPVGSWTAALALDAVDLVTGSKAARNAADGALAVGVVGGFLAAAVGYSDWRYLGGGARRMGMAHALVNGGGIALSTISLGLRATGRRNAGRLAFLAGYSLTGVGAHLGGELSYGYGLRVNRNVFEWAGPDEFTPVLEESELSDSELRRVEIDGDDGRVGILLSRAQGGKVCAISATCSHMGGPLERGDREGDTVVCPWHKSRFDLCSGEAIDGPAVFPQSRYHTRVRDGNIEIKAAADNAPKKVR